MTQDDIQHSGSRWEPTAAGVGAGPQPYGMPGPGQAAVLGGGEHPAGAPYAATATALPPEPDASVPRGSLTGKGLLAAIAAGFLLLGGVGGFAIGQATAGNGGSGTSSVQNGFPGGGPGVGGEGGPFGHGRFDDGDGQGAPVPGDGSGGTTSGGATSGGTTSGGTSGGNSTPTT